MGLSMPRDGAVLLSEYPGEMVRLACRHCDRRGQYHRSTLAARFGTDISLPDLRARLVDEAGCQRQHNFSAPCGAFYPDLAPTAPATKRGGN